MDPEKEKLLRSGKRNWIGFLIAFAVLFSRHFFEGSTNHFAVYITYISAALVIFFLLRALQFGRKLKQHPELATAINDEYIQHTRLKSYRITFWILCVIVISLLFLKDMFFLSTESVLLIILFSLIFIPAIILLILNREK